MLLPWGLSWSSAAASANVGAGVEVGVDGQLVLLGWCCGCSHGFLAGSSLQVWERPIMNARCWGGFPWDQSCLFFSVYLPVLWILCAQWGIGFMLVTVVHTFPKDIFAIKNLFCTLWAFKRKCAVSAPQSLRWHAHALCAHLKQDGQTGSKIWRLRPF